MNAIQVLLGKEGIKQAYDESLSQTSLDIICMSQAYERVIGDYFDTEFAPKLYGKIKTREILPDTKDNRAFVTAKDKSINQVRFMLSRKAGESDMLLSKNRLVMISFGSQPMAIVLTDPEIATSMQQQFEALWNKLSGS